MERYIRSYVAAFIAIGPSVCLAEEVGFDPKTQPIIPISVEKCIGHVTLTTGMPGSPTRRDGEKVDLNVNRWCGFTRILAVEITPVSPQEGPLTAGVAAQNGMILSIELHFSKSQWTQASGLDVAIYGFRPEASNSK